jgi:hypothetical protein
MIAPSPLNIKLISKAVCNEEDEVEVQMPRQKPKKKKCSSVLREKGVDTRK